MTNYRYKDSEAGKVLQWALSLAKQIGGHTAQGPLMRDCAKLAALLPQPSDVSAVAALQGLSLDAAITPKTAMTCKTCGGLEVGADATAVWDGHEWVLGTVYDSRWCNTCDDDHAALVESKLGFST